MRPRFRFLTALVAAVATYGILSALNTPRMGGPMGHGYGRHGWHRGYQAGGCGGHCQAPATENAPPEQAQ